MRLAVTGEARGEESRIEFDPRLIFDGEPPAVSRPFFLAIVASTTLASALVKRSTGRVDGFVVEGNVAGGHNAPPRGRLELDETGQPVYGRRDEIDLSVFRRLGLPFWLAGAYGRPERVAEALAEGAVGVQVGTPFAFCEESALDPRLRQTILEAVRDGTVDVYTDPQASPTGFPFKMVRIDDSLSEREVYDARPRICDLGFLRSAYRTDAGGVAFRCPGEPIDVFAAKGGDPADAPGRRCLCNGLVSNIGLGQVQEGGYQEPPVFTSGADLSVLLPFLSAGETRYGADDVIRSLTAGRAEAAAAGPV